MAISPIANSTRLPSTRALVVFEAASTKKSFLRAAETLNMTPSAVSQQIAKLEGQLGVKLFHRKAQGVELTARGAAFIDDVRDVLGRLGMASRQVAAAALRQPIKIASYAPFYTYWLLPLMQEWEREFPETYIDFWAATRAGDLTYRDEDIVIEYGPLEDARRGGHIVLFSHCSTPVCAPAFLERHGPLNAPDDLHHVPLLHTLVAGDEWREWFATADGEAVPLARHLFRDRGSCLRAAEQGLGVALGCRNLLKHALGEGRLVAPFPQAIAYERGCFLVASGVAQNIEPVGKIVRWLTEKASRNLSKATIV
ncbi:MAG: LysR substrate-binding domain-containing protein [Rhodospirillales bacterium]